MTQGQRRETHLTFRTTEDEARELRLAARAAGVSVSELIRVSVRERANELATGDNRAPVEAGS